MVGTFKDGHDDLCHCAKFGEIEQRIPPIGVKMWRLSFFLSCSDLTGCAYDGVHSPNDHCVMVYGLILIRFSTFFHKG